VLSSAHNIELPFGSSSHAPQDMSRLDELEALLELDGVRFHLEAGYWTKFDVRIVKSTSAVPHGLRYSLTLHDRSGKRIVGFDNAHRMQGRARFASSRIEWDHRHDRERVSPYSFESAGKLLRDFWAAVDEAIRLLGGE
jgi:hypothetical protein